MAPLRRPLYDERPTGLGFQPEAEPDEFAFSPEEEALYLPDPEDYEVDPYQRQEFGQGSFFEPLAGLQNLELPQPRSMGEGFIQGLGRGLGTFGSRAAQRRQVFEQEQARRQALNDQERIEASRRFRADTGAGRRAIAGARLASKKEQERFERENPALTDQDIKANPWLAEAGYGVGSRPPERIRAIVAESRVPESPQQKAARERQETRDRLAQAAADRAATAAERTANTAALNAYDKLQANRAADPAIKAYEGVRSNLTTAEASAKLESGPGDIALIYSWHRALEPDKPNVVREGDVALTREAISALQKVYAVPGRFFSGQQLTRAGRQYFLNQMRAALKAREADYKAADAMHSQAAQRFNVDQPLGRDVSPGAQIKAKGMQFVEP